MEQDTVHFNLELLFGEIGAFMVAPLFAHLASLIRHTPHFISFFGVIGALVGSSIFWLTFRVRNAKIRGEYSRGKIINDILYYTPAATILGILVYQPTFFLLSSNLIEGGFSIFHSILVGQFIAFLCFAILLNIYRFILERVTMKRL